MCTRALVLLLFLLSGAHLYPKFEFRGEGRSSYFTPGRANYDHSLLYRVSPDGDLLVANCSQPETLLQGYDVRCRDEENRMRMANLTVAKSGDYRYEEWSGGNITANRSIRLTVCGKHVFNPVIAYEDGGVLCSSDSALGKETTSIQVFTRDHSWNPTLVLDTNLSPEPLGEHLKGRLQVDLNASLVRYSEFDNIDGLQLFYCTFQTKTHCHTVIQSTVLIPPKYVFGHEHENLSLPCVLRGQMPGQVHWSTPIGNVQLSNNHTLQQEVMYMLNGSQTGDYSLIIPSMAQQHRGEYTCRGRNRGKAFDLIFCSTVSPSLHVLFSHGESVRMDVAADNHSFIDRYSHFHWYRQKDLQPQVMIVDSENKFVVMPEDLRGRVTVERSNYSLLISNLTAEDSGVYTWRCSRRVRDVCAEREIHLVYRDPFGEDRGQRTEDSGVHTWRYSRRVRGVCLERDLVYRDPFGVKSGFYMACGSVLGCVLLGLVAAVIWLKLRSRRVVLTPGGQEMEMQDLGGEDAYDDVEEAEDSV